MRAILLLCACLAFQTPQPKDRYAWEAEGYKLYEGKQYAQSVDAFREAIKAGDKTSGTAYNLACSLALLGKPDDAFAALLAAVKAGYEDAAHLDADADLQSLHADKRWQPLIEASKHNAEARAMKMADPNAVQINVENLHRFFRAYEEARKGSPQDAPAVYDRLYFRDADEALAYMLHRATMTPVAMAKMVGARRPYFDLLDKHQGDLVDQAKALREELGRFKAMYPAARFPDVFVVIGGFNSGGTTFPGGLLIGAELFGKLPETPMQGMGDWERRVLAPPSDFVPLAVHECVHYQQVRFPIRTLLSETLHEGVADFVSYLVTGKMMERTRALHIWANTREREIWLQFKSEMDHQSTKGWLFGDPKPGWPDDVGYWLGFKICGSYYGRAEDKAQALKDILTMTNAKTFLAASRYSEKFGDAPHMPQDGRSASSRMSEPKS